MKPDTAQIKRNVLPLLVIAFIVAAISTGVFYGLFAGRLRAASVDAPTHMIVVAAHDLQRGAVLKAEDLKVSEFRGKTPFKGVFEAPDKLIGATLVEPVQENEPVTERHVGVDSSIGSSGAVPTGMRAVSIHVYESSGLLGYIHRGSKVDIQAVLEGNGTVAMSPVLQDIEVVAVNAQPEQQTQNGRPTAAVLTVLTAPHDSDILALADSGTHLRIALRNPKDDVVDPRKPMNVPMLFRASEGTRTAPAGMGR